MFGFAIFNYVVKIKYFEWLVASIPKSTFFIAREDVWRDLPIPYGKRKITRPCAEKIMQGGRKALGMECIPVVNLFFERRRQLFFIGTSSLFM